jgi:hypothetical protein
MKVNDPNGTGIGGLAPSQDLGTIRPGSHTRGGPFQPRDQVQLSNLSSALYATQTDSPDHTAKLAQLSAVVNTGNYHIDGHTLSGSIIRDALGAAA